MKWSIVLLGLGMSTLVCCGQRGNETGLYRKVHDTLVYLLNSPDTLSAKKLFFHYNADINGRDSFTVAGAEYYGDNAVYAIIVHEKQSKGHSSFEPETIEKWRILRTDEWVDKQLEGCDTLCGKSKINARLFQELKGFWVHVQKYKGEYYLQNDWACLIAYELTDSTWLRINMEVIPELLSGISGNAGKFVIETTAQNWEFQLIDPERKIYRVNSGFGNAYLIPAGKIHDFEIIEYINTTGDLTDAFLKFEK